MTSAGPSAHRSWAGKSVAAFATGTPGCATLGAVLAAARRSDKRDILHGYLYMSSSFAREVAKTTDIAKRYGQSAPALGGDADLFEGPNFGLPSSGLGQLTLQTDHQLSEVRSQTTLPMIVLPPPFGLGIGAVSMRSVSPPGPPFAS